MPTRRRSKYTFTEPRPGRRKPAAIQFAGNDLKKGGSKQGIEHDNKPIHQRVRKTFPNDIAKLHTNHFSMKNNQNRVQGTEGKILLIHRHSLNGSLWPSSGTTLEVLSTKINLQQLTVNSASHYLSSFQYRGTY